MKPGRSSYYPPRAGIGSRLIVHMGYLRRLRGALATSRQSVLRRVFGTTRLPSMRWGLLAAAVLLPGAGVWFRGPAKLARAAVWGAVALTALFIVFLGTSVGNAAFALLLCLHATGLVYFLEPWIGASQLFFRILFSLGVLIGLTLFLYSPARDFVERHAISPVRTESQAVVVRHMGSPQNLRRGDVIAYRLEGTGGHGFAVHEGVGLGPILAKGGDIVQFEAEYYSVNGERHARLPNMPGSGSKRIPEKHWFVWPELAKQNYVNVPAGLGDILLGMSVISEDQLLGKPFKRWFWRRQTL